MYRDLLALILSVLIGSMACNSSNVLLRPSWEEYFSQFQVTGTAILFDNRSGKFKMYNPERLRKRFCPASTFDVVSSLIALQTGIVTNKGWLFEFSPNKASPMKQIEDPTCNLQRAFKRSSVSYYQQLARLIGKRNMQFWLDTLNYGNRLINRIDTFWLDNSLQIAADEQIGLIKKLYFGQLPFRKSVMKSLENMMRVDEEAPGNLYYKIGSHRLNDTQLEWIVGWFINADTHQPLFFVLNVTASYPGSPDLYHAGIAKKVLFAILQQEKYI